MSLPEQGIYFWWRGKVFSEWFEWSIRVWIDIFFLVFTKHRQTCPKIRYKIQIQIRKTVDQTTPKLIVNLKVINSTRKFFINVNLNNNNVCKHTDKMENQYADYIWIPFFCHSRHSRKNIREGEKWNCLSRKFSMYLLGKCWKISNSNFNWNSLF